MGDLGAESIDFLDIVFRLEKAFDIKIPRGELFPEDILTNAQYVQNGKVTPDGVEQLKKRMPFADLTRSANPVVQDFGNLLTVQDMCRYVESKVASAGQSPTARADQSMRWFWIDRFTEFESGPARHGDQERLAGRRASARPFSRRAGDAQFAGHRGPGADRRPAGGRARRLRSAVVLAKVAKARFHFPAVPATRCVYRATIDDINKDGAIVSGTSHVGDRLQARGADLLCPSGRASGRQIAVRSGSLLGDAQAAGHVRGGPRRAGTSAASARQPGSLAESASRPALEMARFRQP